MKTKITILIILTISCTLSAQILQYNGANENALSLKTGWDQTIVTGINYSRMFPSLSGNNHSNIQLEYLSPVATFDKMNNGRLSLGIQSELYRVKHYSISANLFGTFSWTEDITAKIKGLGIYASFLTVFHINNNWILGFEYVFRPTICTYFNFSDATDDTFADRYPDSRGSNKVSSRDNWYPFTNNKYQFGIIASNKLSEKCNLGLKLGVEHFFNDNNIFLNGWIGQIPLSANLNFTYLL